MAAVCCNLLRPSCSPPGLSSAKNSLKFRGCSFVCRPNSLGKEFFDKNVSVKENNADVFHFNRWSYKNSKCANTEAQQVEDSSFTAKDSKTISSQINTFYVFTRAYSCIGVIFIIASSSLIAIERLSDISLPFLVGILKASAAFSCLMVYINGINQVFDIDIDKINKPYLPLASGEMTIKTAISIISCFSLMAFAIGLNMGSTQFLWGLFLYFIILTAYSVKLPFLRWKNSAMGASSSILTSYGIVLPVSTYLHMQTYVFGRQAHFPKALVFGVSAFIIFMVVIAFFKDIPDIEGDKKFGINSFATRLGQEKVFWICVYILEMFFVSAIVVGATSSYTWSKLVTVLGHGVLSLMLWNRAKSIDLRNHYAISSFYQFIWKLLYTECMLIPLLR